jgi:hypothetical protein
MTRSHTLRCVRSKVALSAEVATSGKSGHTGLVNLSGTGCLLENEGSLKVGDVVFLRFALPGQAEVETTGRVARSEEDLVGVAFQNLSEHASERIVRHVVQEDVRRRRPVG